MLDLSFVTIILSLVLLLDVALAALLFYLDKHSPSNQLFSVWMFALASWTVALLAFFHAESAHEALRWMRSSYIVAIIAVYAFWYFATQFPVARKMSAVVHVLNAFAVTVFCIMIYTTDLVVIGIAGKPWVSNVILNPVGWWIYAVLLAYFFLAAHILLFRSYLQAKGVLRSQLLFVVLSVFIGGEIGGVLFNLILPSPLFLNWNYIWLGPTFTTAIIVPFVAYSIARHGLFSIKGMVTQILLGYTMAFAAIDLLLARSWSDFVLRALLAIGIIGFGTLLIRRMSEDERRKRELEDMTQRLAVANKELRELDKVKSEFINIASHQLRTPVSVIKGYLALLEEGAYGKLPVKVKEKVRQMFEMNERLVHLINNFLNMSRIEKKRIEFLITPADIGRTVAQVVEEMRFEVQTKDIGIEFVSRSTPLPFVKADIEKVHEVMINLVDNAVKYSEPKSRIVVSAEPDAAGDFVVVRVADGGIGLTKEERDRLFTKYYRAESKDMPHQQGSGLGLYICRTFIEGMGGRIWVDVSEKGKGTTFAFALPVDKDDPARHQQSA